MVEPRRLTELGEQIRAVARFPHSPYVVALSGGADSATLAAVAPEPKRAIHVHHGWAASDHLAEAARAVAERLDLELTVVEVEVDDGPSPEEMARRARYRALAEKVPASESILLGHTKDDQAETVLLNLVRGAGTRGLSGMGYHRTPNLYRPMLEVSRDLTREFAHLSGFPFLDDPANFDLSLRRSRVRLEIIPLLEELNPEVVDALARAASNLRGDADLLDEMAAAPIEVAEGEARLPVGVLSATPVPLRRRMLASMAREARPGDGLTSAELLRAEEVLSGVASAAELGGGVRVALSGPYLVFRFEPGAGSGNNVSGPATTFPAEKADEWTSNP